MQPHNPSRRGLLGAILAGLFGWLSFGKSEARPPKPLPAPVSTTQAPQAGTTSEFTFNSEDNCIVESGKLSRPAVTTFRFDAQTRLTRITDG